MKSITLGLALSLMGGVAMAQTPPPPSPPPALKQPAAGPATPTPPAANTAAQAVSPTPPAPPAPQSAANGQPAIPTPSGPPEGMIVETPNGFYLVRPGDPAPHRLDLGQNQPGADEEMDQPGMGRGMSRHGMGPGIGRNGPMGQGDEDDEMAGDGMPPHPHRAPPRPPEGKGASLHIHTPNLDVNVKCPDDEPIKACVDAISQLMDKANTSAH